MTIRVTGLTSGLDTESIISALVSAYQSKTEKYTKAQTKLSWTQDAWKSLNTKVYSLYTSVSNLRFSSAYTTKKATVSDSTKVSVTASSSAVNGVQKLKINSVAQSGYMTGGKIETVKETNRDETNTKLSELGYTGGATSFEVKLGDGTSTKIDVTKASTIDDVVTALKGAGLNASFDTNQGRFYVSSKTTGAAADFNIVPSATKTDQDGNAISYSRDSYDALCALGLATSSIPTGGSYADNTASSNVTFTLGGTTTDASGTSSTSATTLTVEFSQPGTVANADAQNALVSALHSASKITFEKDENDSLTNNFTVGDFRFVKKDDDSGYNIYKSSDKDSSNLIAECSVSGSVNNSVTDISSVKDVDKDGNEVTDRTAALYTASVQQGSTGSGTTVTFSEVTSDGKTVTPSMRISFNTPASTDDVETQKKLQELLSKNASKLTLSVAGSETSTVNGVSTTTNKYKMTATDASLDGYTFENGQVKCGATVIGTYKVTNGDALTTDVSGKSATTDVAPTYNEFTTAANSNFATKLDGTDASITLSGVEYTGTSNSFSINGLSINALATTGENEEITITTATDTQAIYDKIKDFLTEYNSIINEMTELYNADSSYGYDPLTDDEKDAMSDTEIEKWETKIKDSLLRNDSTLNGVMMAMINSMSSAYTINGTKYTLSTFGIATLGYLNAAENENYAYHIDGDSDDDNTSSNDDKLMTAITEDPDTVIEFMKQLTSGLYTALGNKMKSTTLSSAYTIYNDKEMNSQYSEYSDTISKWEDKLSDKEDYYYNKFAQMESALTTLQSQSSAVSGLFSS